MSAFLDLLIAFHSLPGQKWPARTAALRPQAAFATNEATLLCFRPHRLVPGLDLHHAAQDPWRAWAIGEIFHYAPAAKTTTENLAGFVSDLAAAQEKPDRLNGHFLIFAWNTRTQQWHVWTDRFATLHAYYGRDGSRAALGTYSPAVAAAASRRKLDWEGLVGFFGFGFFPQDRTHFTDVHILRPASHYIFDADGLLEHQGRYWHWRHEPDRKRSYDDTVAQFHDVFGAVMHDLLRDGRIAVPISGGLDSRTTLAPLNGTTRHRLWSFSYGYTEQSAETRIARRLARCRTLPFESFTLAPYLFDRLDTVLASVEGFQDVTQCRQAFVTDEIGRHADYVVSAHLGDLWLGDMDLVGQTSLEEDAVIDHTVEKLTKQGHRWLLDNVCAGRGGTGKSGALLRDWVREEMARLRHIEDADFRAKACKRETWSFRWTTCGVRSYQTHVFPRLVYDDTRLTDLMCTIPSAFVQKRKLQIDYLKRFAPDLAQVTWQVYDANLFHYQHFNTWLLPKRAWKKAWRVLSGQEVVQRNWELQFLNERGRDGLRHWLLRPGLRLHEFVSREKVQTLLEAFHAAPVQEGRGYTVSMLLSFSAWLERFGG